MPRSVKIAPEIDAKLYQELVSVAKENGQSQRFVLERALEHYLHNVVPSQRMVRPEVMAAYRRSNEKYRELYRSRRLRLVLRRRRWNRFHVRRAACL